MPVKAKPEPEYDRHDSRNGLEGKCVGKRTRLVAARGTPELFYRCGKASDRFIGNAAGETMVTAPRIEAEQMAGIHSPSHFAGQGIPYFKCSITPKPPARSERCWLSIILLSAAVITGFPLASLGSP